VVLLRGGDARVEETARVFEPEARAALDDPQGQLEHACYLDLGLTGEARKLEDIELLGGRLAGERIWSMLRLWTIERIQIRTLPLPAR